ncbi:unnamed protein product, partial [Aphanomyces euteiches]
AYGLEIAAIDQTTGNSVAIKTIPKTSDDLVDAKRIVREICLMRHLAPHIVQQRIAYITYQLLTALRFVHSAHVLHRDIKPSNILVNRDCSIK